MTKTFGIPIKPLPMKKILNQSRKKEIFPNDFFDSPDKLNYTFPKREKFFNTLGDKECSIEDYLRAKLVWDKFECKTFQNYHDIYLQMDVVLLADFFEKFRDTFMETYNLDPAHYYSAPGLAQDAVLKMTKVRLELFDNETMYTFMERSI